MLGLPKLLKSSGVYEILCVPSRKRYVGSAASVYTRGHVHLHQLRRGKHHNSHLQRAWDLYGEAAFQITLLERVRPADLEAREGYWVRFRGSHLTAFGYNIAAVRGTVRGVKRSAKYLKAMSTRKAKQWILTSPNGVEEVVTNLTQVCLDRGLNLDMLFRVAYGRARHW